VLEPISLRFIPMASSLALRSTLCYFAPTLMAVNGRQCVPSRAYEGDSGGQKGVGGQKRIIKKNKRRKQSEFGSLGETRKSEKKKRKPTERGSPDK
jgi:hypothetical protein